MRFLDNQNMTFKNILSGIIGGLIGVILLSLFQYFNYFNLGNLSGYVLLMILIVAVISSLVIDYFWSKTSTFPGRTVIGFIGYFIAMIVKNYSDFSTISIGAVGILIILGLGMSLIIAQIFRY